VYADLEARDLVLYLQLATLQLDYFQIIRRGMCERFADFRVERPMSFFQFRKMRLHGHMAGSPLQIPKPDVTILP
jgi:hypothetical protein